MNGQAGSGRVLCSTGAIITRRNNRDFTLLPAIVPKLNCGALEFMMYESWHGQEDAIRRVLEGGEFIVPVFHMTKQIGQWISEGNTADALAMFRADCEFAKTIGSRLLVLHLWSGQASDQHFERNLAAYPMLRDVAEGYGLLLMVENVVCNRHDPMLRLQQLADQYPDIAFTFDTKMAAFHSQEEELYKPENAWLARRIRHFHVNDYAGGHMDWPNLGVKHLGAGHIDFGKFFAFVRGMDYAGDFTCEATAVREDGSIRYDKMNASLGKIREGVKQ
ncbi:MAG: sugar phosphate isomerase/epimerase [Clostridia bacterium]|nr:sugar phosphate isomerase/epimerase [Clostridia bacterium]